MEKYGISIGELKPADRQPGQPCKKTTRSKTAGPSEATTVSRLLKVCGHVPCPPNAVDINLQ